MGADPRALDGLWRTLSGVVKLADRRLRQQTADAYARVLCAELGGGAAQIPPALAAGLSDFQRNGALPLGQLLPRELARSAVEHLRDRPCYPYHIARTAPNPPGLPEAIRKTSHHGSYAVADVLAAPGLLELANHPALIALAGGYLGCLPSLYSVNCFWSFAGHARAAEVAQRFHRDPDDFRFCTLFAFLTDVDAQSCPHSYVLGSHDYRSFDALFLERAAAAGFAVENAAQLLQMTYAQDGYSICLDPYLEALLPDRVTQLTGEAGTCVLEDTFGLHKGTNPTQADRLIFWARYGLGPNFAYVVDKTESVRINASQRLPSTPASRYVNRLVAHWS